MTTHTSLDNRDQAQENANKLMDYWGRRGWEVKAWVERINGSKQGDGETVEVFHGWVVRTDMVNGMPAQMYENFCRSALAS